jgi:hypothetical protein
VDINVSEVTAASVLKMEVESSEKTPCFAVNENGNIFKSLLYAWIGR